MVHLPKAITDCLDKKYYLCEVDYRDEFSDFKAAQKAIQTRDWSEIDMSVDDMFWESEAEGCDYAMREVTKEIARLCDDDDPDICTERAEAFVDKYRDYLRDEIYDRNASNPLGDLLRHTGDVVFHYDLDADDLTGYGDDFDDNMREIKKSLKLLQRDTTYDRQLTELIDNASFGGSLVVYFTMGIDDMMKVVTSDNNVVIFTNPNIAIIDMLNGSGHDVQLNGLTLRLKFDPTKLWIDKTFKYNYTYAVCGMSSDWCDDTGVEFKTDRRTR